MKKTVSILLVVVLNFVLLLSGCGKANFEGVYSFRMGKLNDKHFAISMSITNDDYVDGDKVLGKKFKLTLDFFSMIDLNEIIDKATAELEGEYIPDIETVLESLDLNLDTLKDGLTFNGYYNLDESEKSEKGTRLLLGFSFGKLIDQIEEKYGKLIKLLTGFDLGAILPDSFTIDNDVIELLVYAHIDDKQINMVIPVSIEDLIYQLYWYGFDLNVNLGTFEKVEGHEVGTHPTAENVAKINETYPTTHKTKQEAVDGTVYETAQYFRDFYTINLALLKE